jgi:hypothetical protein
MAQPSPGGEKSVYGIHQEWHLMPFGVDRTNLFVGRVEYHITEAFDKPDSVKMGLSFGNGTAASASGIANMVRSGSAPPRCVGVERRYDEGNSMAIYTYTFEGIATDHAQKWIEYELEFTMTQEPIETHPDFSNLNDIYGPYDALNRLWPQYITEAAATGLQGGGDKTGGTILNPLYGVSSYFSPGASFRKSYTAPDLTSGALSDIGSISVPKLEGDLFGGWSDWVRNPSPRNWLKMAPKVRQRGSCISVVEEWMLSGPKGWNSAVYQVAGSQGSQGLGSR